MSDVEGSGGGGKGLVHGGEGSAGTRLGAGLARDVKIETVADSPDGVEAQSKLDGVQRSRVSRGQPVAGARKVELATRGQHEQHRVRAVGPGGLVEEREKSGKFEEGGHTAAVRVRPGPEPRRSPEGVIVRDDGKRLLRAAALRGAREKALDVVKGNRSEARSISRDR